MRNFTATLVLLIVVLFNVSAQDTRIVRGTLTDPETGTPMPGVNVVIKGTQQGTTTDVDGNYEIEAPVGSILVFSFVGYTTQEVEVQPLSGPAPGTQKIFRHKVPDDPDKTLSPYFFVKSDDPAVDQLPLKNTSASVNISGVIADVRVKQVYVNTGKHALEAVYIFPGSTRAAVYAMSMTIGNRKLMAKIKEKEKARQEYEQAKSEGKTATLLEQKRPNIFQMNVANILPGDTISVDLQYTELLVPVSGTYEFVYPTVVGPRYSETPDDDLHAQEQWIENPYHLEGVPPMYTFKFDATLNTGVPIQRVTSPSHKVDIQFNTDNSAVIQLNNSETLGGNRDFILRYRLRGGKVESGLMLHPGTDENFFLLMMEPPDAPTLEQIPPREYIFVVDVSGSMQGFPIGVSKRLLSKLISSLRPTDVFNVMLFESSNSMLHERSVRATKSNIEHALRVLDGQQGGGGTRLYPALQKALDFDKPDGFSRTFIVVTDGFVTIEKEAFNLVRDNLNRANLFAFGIGSSVNRYLIEGLAHAGMGEPFFITNEKEADAVGNKFIDLVQNPVLTDININFSGFQVYDVEPLHIPDVFVERPIIVFGKYKGKAEGTVKLTGTAGGERYSKSMDLKTASQENNNALRYLWARNRIKYLDDYAGYFEGETNNYGKPNASNKRMEQVTELGLKYNLLTEYTSFIAVDSLIRNAKGHNEKTKQPLPLPAGVSRSALGLAGISLTPDVMALSEIVVCGYATVQKADVTSSVVTVSAEELSNSHPVSIVTALQGRVPGVNINSNSGTPGGSTQVVIRGNSSLTSLNGPLYVIDGVPIDNTDHPIGTAGADIPDRLASLNPNDIASVTVLKSANATAIYGSRGANGVVVINTKDPRNGRREVTLTSTFTAEQPNKTPELQQEYAQGESVDGQLTWVGPDQQEMFSWGPSMKNLMHDGTAYDYDKNGKLIPISGTGTSAAPYDRYQFFRGGFTADNHLQISQAKEGGKYGVGIGSTIQQGIVPGLSLNRATARLMGEKKFGRKLKLGSSVLFAHVDSDLVQRGNSPSSVMYGLLTTPPSFDNGNGSHGKHAASDENSYQLSNGMPRSYTAGLIDNPYWSVNKNPYSVKVDRITPTIYAEYPVVDNVKVKYRISGDAYRDKEESAFDILSAASPTGQFTNREEQYGHLNSDLLIEGQKNLFAGDLRVSATAGFNYFRGQRKINRTDGFDLSESGRFVAENAARTRIYSVVYDQENVRAMSRVDLKYKEFLNMDFTYSWEETSTLPLGSNHLPSVGTGAAFIFTELPGWNYSSVLSSGKVFLSGGKIQKDAPLFIDPNYFYAATSDIPTPTLTVERVEGRERTNLSAEEVASWEAGTTLSLFENKVDVTAVWYDKVTSNLIVPCFISNGVALMNGGSLSNRGFEWSVRATPVNASLRWSVEANFSKYKSVVTDLQAGMERVPMAGFTSISSNLIKGQPYGVLYGTRYLRNGDGALVIGADGFPMVDPVMGVLGDPNPDWTMGVRNSFTLRNFSFEFLVDIKKGGDVWNGTKNTMNYFGASATTASERNIQQYIFEGVTETGEPNTTPVDFYNPSRSVSQNRWARYGIAGVAEDEVEDGSWVRVRQASLSYDFDNTFISRFGLRKLNLSFIVRNLLLFDRYSGVDPETNLTGSTNGRGIDYFNLPNTRSYGLSLRIGL